MNIRTLIDHLIALQYTHGDKADVWIRDHKGNEMEISFVHAKHWNREEQTAADIYLEAEG